MSKPIAKKSLGQHWLKDEASLEAMCEAAEVNQSDVVLEIGPGLGTLTRQLTGRAKQVLAVEFDAQLAGQLTQRLGVNNLQVIQQDILSFDFTTLPPDYKLVANIPYYLTSNLLRTITETPNPPLIAALLMQKEVAERAAAGPGNMSLLSVSVQFFWQVELGLVVPAELFEPAPKVDSQILILKRRANILFPDVDERQFFRLVRVAFAQKRKTLLNTLSSGLHLGKDEVRVKSLDASIDPARRAQTLSLDEWHQLYQVFFANA